MSPEPLGQNQLLPAITYMRVSGTPDHTLTGPSGLNSPRVQVRCWGDKWLDARTLGAAVEAALDGFQGTLVTGGTYVAFCEVLDERDGYEPESKRHTFDVDFQIHYQE